MIFSTADRSVLAGLADVLIPAADGFPSASQAGVAGDGLDRVLASRPDLAAGLARILEQARGRDAAAAAAALQAADPASFAILAELVPGAYFMNPEVRALFGYDGQRAIPIDPRPDYLDGDLLESVIRRGPIFRPTPRSPGR